MILCGYCLEKVNELHTKHSCEAIGALKKKFNVALLEIQNDFERELDLLKSVVGNVNEKCNHICKVLMISNKELKEELIDMVTCFRSASDSHLEADEELHELKKQLKKEKEDYKHLVSLFDDLKQNYEILKVNHTRLIAASPRNERLVREWEQEESNNHNGGCCL